MTSPFSATAIRAIICAAAISAAIAASAFTDGAPAHPAQTTDGAPFTMSPTTGEPRGYLSVCQTPDGVVHLISSWNHYAFNLAWLKAPMPPE